MCHNTDRLIIVHTKTVTITIMKLFSCNIYINQLEQNEFKRDRNMRPKDHTFTTFKNRVYIY